MKNNMSGKILVTYASMAGSTASIADAIGMTLAEGGAQVEVRPMREVQDLAPYQAVVAGSAIHGSKILPEAMQFLQIHQNALSRRPFAAFLVCITLGMSNAEKYRLGVSAWLEPFRVHTKPVSEGLFAGCMNLSKLPINFNSILVRMAVKLGALPNGDHRDWETIRAWAETTRPLLIH
jgi:menaquinone-dependent protoporphyrinogen oxidase